MTSNAANQANTIITELLRTSFSNVASITNKEEKLQMLADENEEEVVPFIGLLQTKIMLGKAEEGILLAQKIWETGGQISKSQESLFIYQLNALGMFSKALTLLKPKMSLYLSARQEILGLFYSLLRCAIGLGDLDMLSKLAKMEEFEKSREFIEVFIMQMEKNNLKQHFAAQQQILGKITHGKQTAYEVLFEDSRGYPEIEVGIFVGGDSVDRYQLQKQLDESYMEYYTGSKVDVLDNFTFSVFDIKEHWAMVSQK